MSQACSLSAQKIIKNHFGEPCASIISVLLQKGPTLLSELIEVLRFDWWMVRNCLLTLLKHHAVSFTLDERTVRGGCYESDPNTYTLRYKVEIDEILYRIRFAAYLSFIEESHGPAARLLAIQLLQSGSSKPSTAIREAISAFYEYESNLVELEMAVSSNSSDDFEQFKTSHISKLSRRMNDADLQRDFDRMISEGIFTRVLTFPERLAHVARTVPRFESTGVSSGDCPGQHVVPLRKPAHNVGRAPDGSMAVDSHSRTNNRKLTEGSEYQKPPSKRRTISREHSLAPDPPGSPNADRASNTCAYRVNVDFINLEIYKKTLENFFALRSSDHWLVRGAARGLLANVRRLSFDTFVAQPMSFQAIESAVMEAFERRELHAHDQSVKYERQTLLRTLDGLTRGADKMVRSIQKNNLPTFQLDWERSRQLIRRRLSYCMICARFGQSAARIYNLLLEGDSETGTGGMNSTSLVLRYARFWSDAEVSEHALVSLESARASLLLLADAGFVRQHPGDVVGAVPPNLVKSSEKHSYVFGLREDLALAKLEEVAFDVLLNVMERKASEIEKVSKMLLKSDDLSSADVKQLEARQRAEDILEASLFSVDRSLAILREL